MNQPRIVITGMGWVTPLGLDTESVWKALLAGSSGMGRITRFDAETFSTNFAAEVKGFDFGALVPDADEHADASMCAKYALAAAWQAFNNSGLGGHPGLNRRRLGIYLGSGEGPPDTENYFSPHVQGWNEAEKKLDHAAWTKIAYANMRPAVEIEQEANMTLSHVAWALDCRGPVGNCLTACAASNQAIGEAFEILRRGEADAMIAGGAHTMIHCLGVTGFIRLTALSSRSEDPTMASRPFDQTRDGFVMGEGAGMLVLETLEHAQARGAKVLAEIAGYGSSADAFRITDMHPEGRGPQAAIMGALKQAGVNPREPGPDGRPQVHYIAVHGTGTKENDKIETHAIKQVFGPMAGKIPMSSIKSMMGHLIAAAGVSGVITCVQAIRDGRIPPTRNYKVPDEGLDLDYTPNESRVVRDAGGKSAIRTCLCNAYGFGGQNDCLVVKAVG